MFALLATNFAAILDVQGFELSAGEQLLQREQQRQEAIKRDREEGQAPFTVIPREPLLPATPEAEVGSCFDIQAITVEGVEAFSAGQISKIYGAYLNHCLGAVEINSLIRSLTNLYLDAGLHYQPRLFAQPEPDSRSTARRSGGRVCGVSQHRRRRCETTAFSIPRY